MIPCTWGQTLPLTNPHFSYLSEKKKKDLNLDEYFCIMYKICMSIFVLCIICISQVIDISLSSLDSSLNLCFIQPGIFHDVLCIEVK